MRFAAAFVARALATPLAQVLAMKVREFAAWQEAAQAVWEATRLKFE